MPIVEDEQEEHKSDMSLNEELEGANESDKRVALLTKHNKSTKSGEKSATYVKSKIEI